MPTLRWRALAARAAGIDRQMAVAVGRSTARLALGARVPAPSRPPALPRVGRGGAGAARAARQRYKGPVRGGGMANQARSKEEMLAIARERSKQLERERRSKLQEEARRNQEAAEKRLKARNKRHQHHDKHSNKDQRAERRNVRDLDEWEVKQKAKQDLVAQRREREAVAFERRKKAEEERVTNLKAKWKDENDRMGRTVISCVRRKLDFKLYFTIKTSILKL